MERSKAERKELQNVPRMPWREQLSDEQYFASRGVLERVDPELIAEFRAVIAPLEERQGRALDGWGWRTCLRAFTANPKRFRRAAAALETRENVYSPLGVLIRATQNGEFSGDVI
jgi:hypothetical protein